MLTVQLSLFATVAVVIAGAALALMASKRCVLHRNLNRFLQSRKTTDKRLLRRFPRLAPSDCGNVR